MNEIANNFAFEGLGVRIVIQNDEPWFVAADVCDALGIGNASMAAGRLDQDERGISTVDTPSGEQVMVTINESGLYSLILTSRKEAAKRFKKWVTSDVLPVIRKNGQYGAPQIDVRDPAQLTQIALQLIGVNKELQLRAETAEKTVSEQMPKVLAFDRLDDAVGSLCITDAAKTLKIGPKQLFTTLDRMGWIYRRNGAWIGAQDQLDCGRLEHKIVTFWTEKNGTKIKTHVRVTAKGMAYLANKKNFLVI